MLHLVIEIDAETNDMQWLGLPYCSHPNIDYWDVFAISCLYQVLSCDSLADMSYIADKKEKCPGFFLVAILHTTCRIDKLLGFCLKNEFHMAANKKRLCCLLVWFFFYLIAELKEREWQGQTLNFIEEVLLFVILTS